MTQQEQFNINQIKVIAGLGNIGKAFVNTRHNAGFLFVDEVANSQNFSENKKLKCFMTTVGINDRQKVLIKPATMMNLSGDCLSLVQNYFKVTSKEILVVHDDLDIDLGKYKVQFQKGPRDHNGIISIENKLKTSKFWRLRLGLESRNTEARQQIKGHNFVLGKMDFEEYELLKKVSSQIIQHWSNLQVP